MNTEIIPGKLTFTTSNRSILGKVVEEQNFLGFTLKRRTLPRLDDNFQPTNEEYELWEVCKGNQGWFVSTLDDAQLKAIELYRRGME